MKKESNTTTPSGPRKVEGPGSKGHSSAPFSLSELKAKAAAAVPAKPPEENSGLIDLKALMAQAEEAERAEQEKMAGQPRSLQVNSLDIYPFGAPAEATPPPAVAPVQGAEAAQGTLPRRRSRWPGVVAGAVIGFAAIAFAAVNTGIASNQAPGTAQAALTPEAIHRAVPPLETPGGAVQSPVAAPAPAPINAPTPEPAVSEPRPAKVAPHIAKAPVINRTPEEPKEPQKVPEKRPAASDSCNGDLMCAMQRAVKK